VGSYTAVGGWRRRLEPRPRQPRIPPCAPHAMQNNRRACNRLRFRPGPVHWTGPKLIESSPARRRTNLARFDGSGPFKNGGLPRLRRSRGAGRRWGGAGGPTVAGKPLPGKWLGTCRAAHVVTAGKARVLPGASRRGAAEGAEQHNSGCWGSGRSPTAHSRARPRDPDVYKRGLPGASSMRPHTAPCPACE
jgi:hypothetical protein